MSIQERKQNANANRNQCLLLKIFQVFIMFSLQKFYFYILFQYREYVYARKYK